MGSQVTINPASARILIVQGDDNIVGFAVRLLHSIEPGQARSETAGSALAAPPQNSTPHKTMWQNTVEIYFEQGPRILSRLDLCAKVNALVAGNGQTSELAFMQRKNVQAERFSKLFAAK